MVRLSPLCGPCITKRRGKSAKPGESWTLKRVSLKRNLKSCSRLVNSASEYFIFSPISVPIQVSLAFDYANITLIFTSSRKVNMIRTQIQITETQMRTLKSLSVIRGVSMAELIRNSIDEFVQNVCIVDDAEQRRRALQASGQFSSGHSDIAASHDEYLEEAFSS